MFVVTVNMTIHPEHVGPFREAVLRHANNSLTKETGCRQFDVAFDPADDLKVFIFERYDDETAFNVHTASEHFAWFSSVAGPWINTKQIDTWEQATP
jgi:autoinducer 2-degrading protein